MKIMSNWKLQIANYGNFKSSPPAIPEFSICHLPFAIDQSRRLSYLQISPVFGIIYQDGNRRDAFTTDKPEGF